MANEMWKFVQAKSKQAMKQVLGIKDEAARMKVTPPLAVAPLAHTGTTCDGTRTTTASISTPKGAARPGITASGAAQHHSRIKSIISPD